MKFVSPLRYPGGKSKLYDVVKTIIVENGLSNGTYVEPFAGGSGLALKLLINGDVKRIVINDLDPAIYHFWKSILNRTDEFCELINNVQLSISEWNRQKSVFNAGFNNNELEYSFAVFYLNRTNVSGILKGGVIGGTQQNGKYKIDARFNKKVLISRIRRIASFKDQIDVTNFDACELIENGYLNKYRKVLINLDPPYVVKGKELYKNSYIKSDHEKLYNSLKRCKKKWIVTYDVNDFIKDLYKKYRIQKITINYSANRHRKEHEYVIFSSKLIIPQSLNGEEIWIAQTNVDFVQ